MTAIIWYDNTYGQILAFRLYRALREFGYLGVGIILSEDFSGERKSEAIMNRLMKAAGHHIRYLLK